jgi:hypothetical protein
MRLVLLSACVICVLGACSYDWTVAEQALDASPGVDATPDIAVEAARPDADAGDGATTDADAAAKPDCSGVLSDVEKKRVAAIKCEPVLGSCKRAPFKDECSCVFIPGRVTSNETLAYKEAIDSLLASGCQFLCSPQCAGTGVEDRCFGTTGNFNCAQ